MGARSLILLRHAKSSWEDPSLRDFERPLAPRGERASERMGVYVAGLEPPPGVVLCSTALRARATLTPLRELLRGDPAIWFEDEIYMASEGSLLDRLRQVGESEVCVLMVGHNPGIEDLALLLAGGGDQKGLKRMARKFPTAACAQLSIDVPRWADLAPGEAMLERFVRPKDLPVE